jgi:hypothetical protein
VASNEFILRMVQQLRAVEGSLVYFGVEDHCQALADRLAWFVEHDECDRVGLHCTGNEDEDRMTMAEWLDHAANGPAFTSPSWTRMFSEFLACHLRHNLPVTTQTFEGAFDAYFTEMRANVSRRMRSNIAKSDGI